MNYDWPVVSLGEVAEIITGFPFKSSEYTDSPADVYLLRGDNIGQGVLRWQGVKRWPVDKTATLTTYWLREGDVVLAMDRPWIEAGLKFAKVRKSDLPSLLVQRVACLRGSDMLETDFINYVLSSREFTSYVLGTQTGTAVPHISTGQIKAFRFKLPTLSEQQHIVNILGTIDDKIALNRQINQTLEAMAQALFKSWFVDFEPVRAKVAALETGEDPTLAAMRAISGKNDAELSTLQVSNPDAYDQLHTTASLFPAAFEESELGLVPESWEVCLLGDVTSELRRGITPKYIEHNGVCVINQKCIRHHSIDFMESRRHDNQAKSIIGREIAVGDVLINSTGVGTLGRLAQVKYLNETTIVDTHVTVVRSNNELINSSYLGSFLLTQEALIEASGAGSTGQTELRRQILEEIKLIIPPNKLLEIYAQHHKPLSEITANYEQEQHNLSKLRDTLLPKLLSGELAVGETILEQVIA